MQNRDPLETEHLNVGLRRRAAQGGAITIAGQAVKLAIQIGSVIILARLLPPEVFGLMAMVLAITGLAAVFSDLGLSVPTVQRKEISQGQVSLLFWVNVSAGAVTALTFAALAPAIAWFYDEPALIGVTLALAVTFIFSGIAAQHKAVLQRQMRFGSLLVVDIMPIATGAAVAIYLALWGAGYWALVTSHIAVTALGMVLSVMLSGWRPGAPGLAGAREVLSVGGHLTGFNIINYAARNLDNVLIGWWWGAAVLGFYDRAYRLFTVPLNQINQPVSRIAIPVLSRLQDEPERYRRAYLRMLGMLLSVTVPGVTFVTVMVDDIIWTLLGPQWMQVAQILFWLAISALVQPLSNTTGWLFITQGRTRELLRWGIVGGGLTIISFVVGLPWGASGVAASYAISGLLIRTPVLLWWVTREGPIKGKDLSGTIATFILTGIAAVLALVSLQQLDIASPFLRLSLALILCYMVSFGALTLTFQGRTILRELVGLLSGRGSLAVTQG